MHSPQLLRHKLGPLLVTSLLVSLFVVWPVEALPVDLDFSQPSLSEAPAGSIIGMAFRDSPPSSRRDHQNTGYSGGTNAKPNDDAEVVVPESMGNGRRGRLDNEKTKEQRRVGEDNEIELPEHGSRRKRTLSINSDIALLSSGFRRALKSNWAEYWIKQLEKQKIKKRSLRRYDKRTLSINSDIKVLSAGFRRALKMNALRQQLRMLMNE